jgi:hypothetical protein
MAADGARLGSRRLPEGLAGIRVFYELVAEFAEEPAEVVVGIETDRGLWVESLVAAGLQTVESYAKLGFDLIYVGPLPGNPDPVGFIGRLGDEVVPNVTPIG